MKKLFMVTLLLTLSVSLYAQTNVSGGIYSNTTWTKANSPYLVTSELVIFDSLTIEPGVTVLFDSKVKINVRGTLTAIGTKTDSIIFVNSQAKANWSGIYILGTLNAKYCIFEGADTAVNYVDTISFCSFINNSVGVYYGGGFDSCSFTNNVTAISNPGLVKNSYFNLNTYAITSGLTVSNCIFENNTNGITAPQDLVDSCTFLNNGKAILEYNDVGDPYFTNNYLKGNNIAFAVYNNGSYTGNTIIGNDTGMYVDGAGAYPVEFKNNIICHNTYNIVLNTTYNVDAQKNCWCLSDSAAIRATIYDGYTNINLGLVYFDPFNTCTDPTTITAITAAQNLPTSFVTVAPNPNSGSFNVQLQGNTTPCAYSVYDGRGTTVANGTISNNGSVNLSGSTPGIYYLVVFSGQQKYTEKVVVE